MKRGYRADIDGLRAIAIMFVVFYHLKIPFFGGGYIGVDIFFVISGYLVTQIVAQQSFECRLSLIQFYRRRVFRIVPAYIVMVACTLGVGSVLLSPDHLYDLGQSAIAALYFSSNILFYIESGYFDAPSELKSLLHTWSLSVEVQFYLVCPILILYLTKLSQKRLWVSLWGLCILSLLLCGLWANEDPDGAFYLIFFRLWEFLVGSIVALASVWAPNNRVFKEILAVGGMWILISCCFVFSSQTNFPGFITILPILGCALVIFSGEGSCTVVSRVLSLRPLVFLGLISYSIYLWHWPAIVFSKLYLLRELDAVDSVVVLAAVFLISFLSWRFIELPFRDINTHVRRNLKPGIMFSGFVLLIVLAGGTVFKKGFPSRLEGVEWQIVRDDPIWKQWSDCEAGIEPSSDSNYGLCSIGEVERGANFILWGDSHARALASGVDAWAKDWNEGGLLATKSSCPPLLFIDRLNRRSCSEFNSRIFEFLSERPDIGTVVLAARWALSAEGTRYEGELGDAVHLVDAGPSSDGEFYSNEALFELGLKRTVSGLLALGKKVILVGPIPEVGHDVPSIYYLLRITGRDVNEGLSPSKKDYLDRNNLVQEIFAKIVDDFQVELVQPGRYLCGKKYCKVLHNRKLLYRDGHHLSTFGAEYLTGMFDSVFENVESKLD